MHSTEHSHVCIKGCSPRSSTHKERSKLPNLGLIAVSVFVTAQSDCRVDVESLRASKNSNTFNHFFGLESQRMKCPRCGSESEPTRKRWEYNVFHVESYYCKKCDKRFNAYYREEKLIYTISKIKNE